MSPAPAAVRFRNGSRTFHFAGIWFCTTTTIPKAASNADVTITREEYHTLGEILVVLPLLVSRIPVVKVTVLARLDRDHHAFTLHLYLSLPLH